MLAIVFLTTIIGGGAMPGYIRFMLARSKNTQAAVESVINPAPLLDGEAVPKRPGMIKMLDEVYIKPFLIHDY